MLIILDLYWSFCNLNFNGFRLSNLLDILPGFLYDLDAVAALLSHLLWLMYILWLWLRPIEDKAVNAPKN